MGEFDISWANAAHAAIIASNLAKVIGGIPKFLSGAGNALSKLTSGKIGTGLSNLGGKISSFFGSGAGNAAGSAAGRTLFRDAAGNTFARNAAGRLIDPTTGRFVSQSLVQGGLKEVGAFGLTKGTLSSAALPAAGAVAGGVLAADGFKSAFDETEQKGTRALGAVEGAAGATAAGALGLAAAGTIAAGTAAGAAGTGIAGGLAAAGAAAGPIGWIALAVAGIALLGKAAYDNATELSGNAKAVKEAFNSMKDSMQEENLDRLKNLAETNKQFKEAESLEDKRKALTKANIASDKELHNLSEESLQTLLDSYTEAAKRMNSVTESLVDARSDEVAAEVNKSQKEVIEDLTNQVKSGELAGEDLKNAMSMLMSGVTDEDLLEKWEKAKKDDKITALEANDLLYGGMNSWFDKTNLTDLTVEADALSGVNTLYGKNKVEVATTDLDKDKEASEVLANLTAYLDTYRNAKSSGDADAEEAAHKTLISEADKLRKKADLLDYMKESKSFKSQLKNISSKGDIPEFREGLSNVPNDGFAILHKGEAVLTKNQAVQARADGGIGIGSILGSIGNKIKGLFEESGLGELLLSALGKIGLTQSFLDLDEELTLDTLKYHKQMRRLLGIDIAGGDAGTSGSAGKGTLAGKVLSALGIGGSSGGTSGGLLSLITGKSEMLSVLEEVILHLLPVARLLVPQVVHKLLR